MEISCPLCESHKTQRLALTYAKGVSHSESTTVGAGASISPLTILGFVFFPIAIAIGALGGILRARRDAAGMRQGYERHNEQPGPQPGREGWRTGPFSRVFFGHWGLGAGARKE